MANANRATCPRCGAPISSDEAAGLCPRCRVPGTQGGLSEDPPVSPSSSGRVHRRRIMTLALAVAAIAAIVLVGLWSVNRWKHMSDAIEHYNLAVDLQEQGKLEEAIAEYRESIRLKPNDATTHFNLGNALQAQRKLAEAVAEFGTVVRIKPDYAEAYYQLGLGLAKLGTRTEAAAAFRRARDNAQRGSKLARLIERALADTDS
jgi:tetratricopeptide (TPR) repeat protein